MTESELITEWLRLKTSMDRARAKISVLAAARQEVTLKLYALPGMTDRKLGALLGVSGVSICVIRHLGEPKPGSAGGSCAAPDSQEDTSCATNRSGGEAGADHRQ